MDLKDVKEESLIGLAVFEVATKIDNKPDFCCWVTFVFKKQDRIIAKANT